MVSSWAGAMGQTQFMPSNFFDYAIDFSGDGQADIWNNVPDVLASTANYLRKGWTPGCPGVSKSGAGRIRLHAQPRDFRGMASARRAAHRRRRFPTGHGILFFPSGYSGPAFIVTENFDMLKEYNNSDAYAIAIGLLADRIRRRPIKAAWPEDDTALREARIALQKKLATLGYKVNEFHGHIDFDLRDNIRFEQVKFGMLPDGNPIPAFLEKLGAVPSVPGSFSST